MQVFFTNTKIGNSSKSRKTPPILGQRIPALSEVFPRVPMSSEPRPAGKFPCGVFSRPPRAARAESARAEIARVSGTPALRFPRGQNKPRPERRLRSHGKGPFPPLRPTTEGAETPDRAPFPPLTRRGRNWRFEKV